MTSYSRQGPFVRLAESITLTLGSGACDGPVQGVSSIRTTAKKDKIFVHVFDWPRGPLEIAGFQGRALSAYLVAGESPGSNYSRKRTIFMLDSAN